jgi:hypothetical protein
MFVESNSVFEKENIYSLEDLKSNISPNNTNYYEEDNPLYQFLAYHVVPERISFSDLTQSTSELDDESTELNRSTTYSYNTMAYYPLQITIDEDMSLISDDCLEEVGINYGLAVYDTIVSSADEGNDTTLVDHISIIEDISNMATLSGVMHFIDYTMEVDTTISPSTQTFQFRDDPNISYYYGYISDKTYYFYEEDLESFEFEGDVAYIKYFWSEEDNGATNNDYISFSGGDFALTYRTTAIMQGDYTLRFKVKINSSYGFFDVSVDGVKIGNTVNIASKSENGYGFNTFEVGDVFLSGYNEHEITIESVTPCCIYWDFLQFAPF